jgi:glycosyltransferase involved in cell wall biosynthesis
LTLPFPTAAFSQKPPVSVVVGCFNQADFVETALRSVAQQSYGNFECVVVDDASTDLSREKIRAYLGQTGDERFRFLERTSNGGQMTSMMQGFDGTDSPFVAFLDADDVWDVDFLEQHVKAHLSRDGIAAVSTSDQVIVNETGTILAGGTPMFREGDPRHRNAEGRQFYVAETGDYALIFINRSATRWLWSTTSGMMFRRDAIEAMRPQDPSRIRHCADAYLAPATHMLGGTVRIERVLGSYRIHNSNGWANHHLLGSSCRIGTAPPDTDEQIRAAIAERWCIIAPDFQLTIPKREMGRTLVRHMGWRAALDLVDSSPDARWLLGDWARPYRRRLLSLVSYLPRPLRPRPFR